MQSMEMGSIEVIHPFKWNDWYRRLQQFGESMIDDVAATVQASRSIDKHVIVKRLTPEEVPDYIRQEAAFLAVQHIQVFHVSAYACPMIHVDGIDRNCAINIPLRGAELGRMEWFDFPFRPYVFRGQNTISTVTLDEVESFPLRWSEKPAVSTLLDQPCVVRTNKWHRIDNRDNPKNRYVLSIRMKDNPTFEHIVKCLTPVEELYEQTARI